MRSIVMLCTAMALASSFFSHLAHAVKEDHTYVNVLNNHVLDYFYFRSTLNTFRRDNGVTIAYRVFEPVDANLNPVKQEQGAIVIVPGRGLPMDVFAETIYDLAPHGYTMYILDHRGQGHSGRLVDNFQKQYVESFDDYVDDLNFFVDNIVQKQPHQNLFFLAESMGGAIASLYMKRHQNHPFKACVLAVPMFGINTGFYPESLLYGVAQAVSYLGGKESYFFGQGDYQPISAQASVVTKSEYRYDMMKSVFTTYNIATGGISFQWFIAAKNAMYELDNFGLTTPTLILQAQHEQIVRNDSQHKICKQSSNCQLVVINDAYHEVFLERDHVRDQALQQITSFFATHLPQSARVN